MKNVVSDLDVLLLAKIRANVRKLIEDGAQCYGGSGQLVLDIAPQDHLGACEFFSESIIYTLDIDERSNASFITDICRNNKDIIPDSMFDVVVCTEVLEHTLNPFNAVNEIYRVLKTEGVALISTPFNFRIHGPLPDCWRFTEYGLRELFKKFEMISLTAYELEERYLMPYQYTLILKK